MIDQERLVSERVDPAKSLRIYELGFDSLGIQ